VWVRCLLVADRGVEKAAWLVRTALGRVICVCTPPERRDEVTAWVYGKEVVYRPGSALLKPGLFPWESEAVQTPPFPGSGRLLVGGVGGGRELVGLASLGYEVVAFEPSSLVEGASQVASDWPGTEVVQASYRDLIAAADGRASPLSRVLADGFDGVVLGWGSLSHVVSADERQSLLASLRRLLPSAPVLCSFWSDPGPHRPTPAQRALHRVGNWAERLQEPGLRFQSRSGFIHVFTRDELESLARDAGYDPVLYEGEPFPHALLAPLADEMGVAHAS
jgi:hypothetical protein